MFNLVLNMVKLLVASDLHGDIFQVRKLAEKGKKENIDAVILCGDIADSSMNIEGMIGPFKELKKPVMFVPGNHESPIMGEFIATKYEIINLQGYSARIRDKEKEIGFLGCGGADIGFNFTSEDDMEKYLRNGWNSIRNCGKKILVTHIHPKGSEVEKEFGWAGSESLRKFIEKYQPDLHLNGHIHEAEGFESRIGNTLSLSIGSKGKIIEI